MNAEQVASSLPNAGSRKVFKDEAKSLIERELTALNGGLVEVLSRYQPNKAVRTWHGTIRAIEELINIPLFGIKDVHLVAWLNSIRMMTSSGPMG